MQFLPGDKVCFRASAVTPLDPKAHWRGVVQPGDGAGWIRVIWTMRVRLPPNWAPLGLPFEAPREAPAIKTTIDTWEDPTLLAKVGSLAARDRHVR